MANGFDGHVSVKIGIKGPVNHAHASLADDRLNHVSTNDVLSGMIGHGRANPIAHFRETHYTSSDPASAFPASEFRYQSQRFRIPIQREPQCIPLAGPHGCVWVKSLEMPGQNQ